MISKVNKFLAERLKKMEKPTKMSVLATQSVQGHLSSFAGVFGVTDLETHEKEELQQLLQKFAPEEKNIQEDLKLLITVTSEVKAINNQAVILHGERIKTAQQILKKYRDGAFTEWLISTYGNRQSPYNFLQYYEFYISMPQTLRPLVEIMPKQAIYTLASREGPLEQKQHIVQSFRGETKKELLSLIRDTFPLSDSDKRKQSVFDSLMGHLAKLQQTLMQEQKKLKAQEKKELREVLHQMELLIKE